MAGHPNCTSAAQLSPAPRASSAPATRCLGWLAATLAAGSLAGCSSCERKPEATEHAAVRSARAEPEREPIEPLPTELDLDQRKVALGRRLYHDNALSGDGTIACVTCHSFDHGGAENKRTSTGIRGQVGPINAPTVLNAGYNFVQFWDGRAATLEEQAAGPVENPIEMGASWDDVVARLSTDESYASVFGELYRDGVTKANVTHAIAEFERSLVTPSPFDAFLRGDVGAISAEQRRGYDTFKSAGCTSCHMGTNVGGTMYQKMGLVRNWFEDRGGEITEADLGRFNVTQQDSDRHFFKVPTLRNIALTAPYLHDGSQQSLEETVKIMGRYQLGKDLNDEEVRLIVAFLHSLTGEVPEHARTAEADAEDTAAGDGETAG